MDDDDVLRMPLFSNEHNDMCAAGCLARWLEKMAPGKLRLFCKVKKGSKTKMYPTVVIGLNQFPKIFKKIGEDAGLVDLLHFLGHSLRKLFITALANNPNVSLAEAMTAARHMSVSASQAYQRRNGLSKAARFNAIGQGGNGIATGNTDIKQRDSKKYATTKTLANDNAQAPDVQASGNTDSKSIVVTVNVTK